MSRKYLMEIRSSLGILVIMCNMFFVHCTIPEIRSPTFTCLRNILNNRYAARNILIGNDPNILDNLAGIPLITITESLLDKVILKVTEKPETYTIVPQTINSFEKTIAVIVASKVYQNAKYTVLINSKEDAQLVAHILWKFRLPHSLIIVSSQETDEFDIYKITVLDCGSNATAIHSMNLKKNVSCVFNMELFEFNFKFMFKGCPLNVLWNRYPPFVYKANQTWGWKGILIEMLEPLSHITQREIILSADDTVYFEEASTGFSFSTLIEDLKEADIFVGSAGIRTFDLFDLSPIVSDDFIVYLSPKIPVNYWKQLISLADKTVVGIFTLMLIAVGFIIFYLAKFNSQSGKVKNLQDILLLLYGTLLGAGVYTHLPNYFRLRLFLGYLLLLFGVINVFIQGSLVSALTSITYEPPISTRRELKDSQFPLKLNSLFTAYMQFEADFSKDQELTELNQIIQEINETNFETILDTLIKERNFHTLMFSGMIFMRPNLERTFSYFTYDISYSCFATTKHSFSSPYFYNWISNILETGFLQKYKQLHHVQLALKYNQEADERNFKVTIAQIRPLVTLLEYGYYFSVAILLLELVYYRWIRNYTNKLVCTILKKNKTL